MASVCKVVTTLDGRVHRVAQHIVVFVALCTRAGRATGARRLLVFAARDQILLGVNTVLIMLMWRIKHFNDESTAGIPLCTAQDRF